MEQYVDKFLIRIQNEFSKIKNDPTLHWTRKEQEYSFLITKIKNRYDFKVKKSVPLEERVPAEVLKTLDDIEKEKKKINMRELSKNSIQRR